MIYNNKIYFDNSTSPSNPVDLTKYKVVDVKNCDKVYTCDSGVFDVGFLNLCYEITEMKCCCNEVLLYGNIPCTINEPLPDCFNLKLSRKHPIGEQGYYEVEYNFYDKVKLDMDCVNSTYFMYRNNENCSWRRVRLSINHKPASSLINVEESTTYSGEVTMLQQSKSKSWSFSCVFTNQEQLESIEFVITHPYLSFYDEFFGRWVDLELTSGLEMERINDGYEEVLQVNFTASERKQQIYRRL